MIQLIHTKHLYYIYLNRESIITKQFFSLVQLKLFSKENLEL